MNELITVLLILGISFIGFFLIKIFSIFPKKSPLYIFSLGYGLGVGLITAQMYLYARLGVLWTTMNIFILWVIVISIFYFIYKPKIQTHFLEYKKIDKISWGFLGGIFFSVSYTIFEAVLRPLSTWDGWAAWIIKSKAFFLDKTITAETLQYIRSDGPLIISLLGSLIYIVLGKADDTAVLLQSSAYYIFTLVFFYSVLKENYSLRYSLFFTFLLATTQTLIRQGGRLEAGQADLPLGYYFLCSTFLFFEYLKTGKTKIVAVLMIFLAITTLVKFEGFPFTLEIGILTLVEIYREKRYEQLFLFSLWLLPVLDWQLYKKILNLDRIYVDGHVFVLSFEKIKNSLSGTFLELVNIKSWNVLWIIYFYCVFFLLDKHNKNILLLHFFILSQLLLYLFVYFFTFGNAPNSSIERLLAHIAPLAIAVIAFTYKNIPKKEF